MSSETPETQDNGYGFSTIADGETAIHLDGESQAEATEEKTQLPPHVVARLLKTIKRQKKRNVELQKRKIKNRRKNKIARKSSRINRILKNGR
jgi:hypothetical protein